MIFVSGCVSYGFYKPPFFPISNDVFNKINSLKLNNFTSRIAILINFLKKGFKMTKVFTPETGTVNGACTLQGGYAR